MEDGEKLFSKDCKNSKDGLGASSPSFFYQVLCCNSIANGEIVVQFYANILKPDFLSLGARYSKIL